MVKGIGASPGIVIGKVLLKRQEDIKIVKRNVDYCETEIKKLIEAVDLSRGQLNELCKYTHESIGEEEARIFEAHKMILDDPEFFSQVQDIIKSENVNSEYAVKKVADMYMKIFDDMENEYMRERASDIKDVTERIIKNLLGLKSVDFSELNEEVIIVAEDLTPSDTARMDKSKVKGFVTEKGGKTSHSAIMARTLGIPAVVGIEGITLEIKDGDIIALDGEEGEVIINPEEDVIENYDIKKQVHDRFNESLNKLRGIKSVTKDDIQVELACNIGTCQDIESVLSNDGEGIGLFRTEFLYMDKSRLPSEDEQFAKYKEAAEKMKGKPVVIRTLDIGGDKELTYLRLDHEMNPFLGYRAIRLCLDREDIFKPQLRALLRASAYGNIKIMFPMISSMEELCKAKETLNEVKEDLRKENIKFNEEIEVGMMIEVPAAAVISDILAKEVDFFSIGTNDLIQYTTAVDRGNGRISNLYNPFHPAVLRLIKQVIDNGHKQGIWVGMCGEAAGDPRLIPIFIGMGLDEFSMSPTAILKSRWIIKNINQKEMKELVESILNLPTADDIERFIDKNIKTGL